MKTRRRDALLVATGGCAERLTYMSEACASNAAYLLTVAHPDRPLEAAACGDCPDWHLADVAAAPAS